MKVKSKSEVAQSFPPSVGFSRQEYWSGVPLPSLNSKTPNNFENTSVTIRKDLDCKITKGESGSDVELC